MFARDGTTNYIIIMIIIIIIIIKTYINESAY